MYAGGKSNHPMELSVEPFIPHNHNQDLRSNMAAVVLVTGGTGLVGKAIEWVIENEPKDSRFGKREGEKWIFASSREADLRYVRDPNRDQGRLIARVETQNKPWSSSKSINLRTSSIWPPLVYLSLISCLDLSDARTISWRSLCQQRAQGAQ